MSAQQEWQTHHVHIHNSYTHKHHCGIQEKEFIVTDSRMAIEI